MIINTYSPNEQGMKAEVFQRGSYRCSIGWPDIHMGISGDASPQSTHVVRCVVLATGQKRLIYCILTIQDIAALVDDAGLLLSLTARYKPFGWGNTYRCIDLSLLRWWGRRITYYRRRKRRLGVRERAGTESPVIETDGSRFLTGLLSGKSRHREQSFSRDLSQVRILGSCTRKSKPSSTKLRDVYHVNTKQK